ncbi:MAG: hypothetical protein E3J72_03000 [Planctomycetota bacterium]|nr:MAG: hypothetical protein E3J72_03000 [Planctomycetota bacterium]
MVAPLAENAFYFNGITSPGNSPNAAQVAQSTQTTPATADRVEISNAAEDVLRAATGTPKTTESPQSKASTAESASRMPPQSSVAAQQQVADETRERQVRNISTTYKVVGESDDIQSNLIDPITGENFYQAPTDQTVVVEEQDIVLVGQIFDSLM